MLIKLQKRYDVFIVLFIVIMHFFLLYKVKSLSPTNDGTSKCKAFLHNTMWQTVRHWTIINISFWNNITKLLSTRITTKPCTLNTSFRCFGYWLLISWSLTTIKKTTKKDSLTKHHYDSYCYVQRLFSLLHIVKKQPEKYHQIVSACL